MTLDRAMEQFSCAAFTVEIWDDHQIRFSHFNACAEKLTGLPARAVLGLTPAEAFPERTAARLEANYRAAFESAQPVSYQELLVFGRRESWWRTSLTPMLDGAGRVVRLLGLAHEVSAERRAQLELLQQAQGRADARDSSEFVALAAHDLRAPMRQISGLLEELRDGFEDLGDGKDAVMALIGRVAEKAQALTDDVLGYALALRAPERCETVQLDRLVDNIAAILDPSRRHCIETLSASVFVEFTALQVALRNMIDNAIKHSGRDAAEIRIAVETAQEGMLAFTVSDNGDGFDDPAAIMQGVAGLRNGYGLSALSRIAQRRGGALTLRNRAEGGAELTLHLPGAMISESRKGGRPE